MTNRRIALIIDSMEENREQKKQKIINVPNFLCIFRILLVPVFVVLYLRAEDFTGQLVAASVIALAGITDFLDGFLARKFHLITEFGKIVDPLADKLLQAGIAIALMVNIPYMWILFAVFAVKELTMFFFQAYLYRRGKKLPGALWYGKVATTVFYLLMIVLLFIPASYRWIQYLLMLIVGGFLIMAFVLYMLVLIRMYREWKRECAAKEIERHIDGDSSEKQEAEDESRSGENAGPKEPRS